jgi:VIT1/CCC1 family predicted Fe2+/Mn2+ transporter
MPVQPREAAAGAASHPPRRPIMRLHREVHRSTRIVWLRAAVLGANDGLVSVSSLVVGVAASGTGPAAVLPAGVGGLVAGALIMAAGEYVSVQSQADTERADLRLETRELAADPAAELNELAAIYLRYGLDEDLAFRVAERLTAVDALGTHAREELWNFGYARLAAPSGRPRLGGRVRGGGGILPVAVVFVAPPPGVRCSRLSP